LRLPRRAALRPHARRPRALVRPAGDDRHALRALRERRLGERGRDRRRGGHPALPPAGPRTPTLVTRQRAIWAGGALVLLALVLLLPQLLGTYYLSLLTESVLYAIAALSLDLVWGYTGITDLGHALRFGTGALAVGIMTTDVDPTGLVLRTYGGFGPHLAGI